MGFLWLANLVAILHAFVVLFVIGGAILIPVGIYREWTWVYHFGFRIGHLSICLIVVGFELAGRHCPLTDLENDLRDRAGTGSYDESFIYHYVTDLIHVDWRPEILAIPTLGLCGSVIALYWWRGPHRQPLLKEKEKDT